MTPLKEVPIASFPLERFQTLVGERWGEVETAMRRAREIFAGRVVWHVNSTARGGGVVELLTSLLAYARGAGVDNRWVVINAGPEFFRVTKRIHNNLHGSPGDGGPLGVDERQVYEATCEQNARELASVVRSSDVVFLHDPQTAGMARMLRETGVRIVWRCHVGLDLPNDDARRAWDFLRPYTEDADAYVFSRRDFVWDGLEDHNVWIVPPSVDAFSPKNQDLDPPTVDAILDVAGLREDHGNGAPVFQREDGSPGRVDRTAEVVGGAIPAGAPVVAQVSRWDRLKDPAGVLRCFAEHSELPDAHLLLAGPSVNAVADDPEGAEVLDEVRELRESLGAGAARRTHLACLPMTDVEENAAIVNAIQRHAAVVVQKSIAEGFGLTVAEAMWKSTPVVASGRGGIKDQIVQGESGVLIDDPLDLDAFGTAIEGLIADPTRAAEIGVAARERIREHFLGTRHLTQYLDLLDELIS
ncbi:MAG TPA: glycosyltransferase [Solirubrobacterales bacterium]|jgi:trehalose synthase|nr:glycosyltransferase [Solirubrobacterales bacterium]